MDDTQAQGIRINKRTSSDNMNDVFGYYLVFRFVIYRID